MSQQNIFQLEKDISEFLAFKRQMGFKYNRAEYTLRSFLSFAKNESDNRGLVCLEHTLNRWLARIESRMPVTVALDLGVIRQLCLHKRRRDPHCFIPDRSWAPQHVESTFLPYVFSVAEIKTILRAAREYCSRTLNGNTLYSYLLVLYCTGLRPGEGTRLRLPDVNLDDGMFIINESKGKTRNVPFSGDLTEKLRGYCEDGRPLAANHDGLWVQRNGNPVSYYVMYSAVRRLFCQLGLKPKHGRVGPRPYDIRHAFAVHRLTSWYKQGVDVNARLPWLSAYMGHDNILGTEVYLHATPELLAIASDRFAERVGIGANRR